MDFDRLLADTDAAISQDRGVVGWWRARGTPVRVVGLVAGVAAAAALSWIVTRRADWVAVAPGRFSADAVALLAAAGLTAWSVARPLWRAPMRPVARAVCFAIGLALLAWPVIQPEMHVEHPASFAGRGEDFWKRALGCLAFGTVWALPLWGLARWTARHRVVVPAAALWAGSGAMLALAMHCPITYRTHLWVGHVGPVVLFALAAAAWGWHRSRR